MNFIFELMYTIVTVVYDCCETVFFALLPTSFRRKKSLSGEIAVVTGAASGLGRQVSLRLARLGVKVVLWDIDAAGLEETRQLIAQQGGAAHHYECNVADRFSVYMTAEQVKQDVGDATILVNNAGIVTGKRLLDCADEDVQKTMDVNATAHFWTIKALLPAMLEAKHGHIVTISSLAGKMGISQLVDYCTSKFAAVGLHASLAAELRNSGVNLTNICPYFINTGMFLGLKSRVPLIFPGLDQYDVADRIILAIQLNEYEVIIPWSFNVLVALSTLLPPRSMDAIAGFFGLRDLMSTFIGREDLRTRAQFITSSKSPFPLPKIPEDAVAEGTTKAA